MGKIWNFLCWWVSLVVIKIMWCMLLGLYICFWEFPDLPLALAFIPLLLQGYNDLSLTINTHTHTLPTHLQLSHTRHTFHLPHTSFSFSFSFHHKSPKFLRPPIPRRASSLQRSSLHWNVCGSEVIFQKSLPPLWMTLGALLLEWSQGVLFFKWC